MRAVLSPDHPDVMFASRLLAEALRRGEHPFIAASAKPRQLLMACSSPPPLPFIRREICHRPSHVRWPQTVSLCIT
jgi:hypothetical protein